LILKSYELPPWQGHLTISKLDNGKHRELFKSPLIDWCASMAGAANSKVNPLLKTMLATMKKAAAAMMHRCPYYGPHEVQNITMDRSILMIYPAGKYRFVLRSFNDFDTNICSYILNIKIF